MLTTGMLTPKDGFDKQCWTDDEDYWSKSPGTDKDPHVAAIVNWFGIADVVVQTAGGGGGGGGKHQHTATTHMGLIEGLADATRIRDLILSRVNQSRSAGLGDEHHADGVPTPQPVLWTPEHVAVLREIRRILASS